MQTQRICAAFFWFLVLWLGPNSQAARLGIVSRGDDLGAASDLLTATLSKQPGIELLERAELDRLVQERALNISQASDAAKVLGADALMFLESSGAGTNTIASVRVVATRAGVVLYSTRLAWPPGAANQWAENITPRLAQAVAKTTVSSEKAKKLSVLNLRSAVNSTSQQLLERELTSLLLTRLAQEPEIFVLERRQLAAASFEKELAASEERFWTGSYLLDGTINREGFDPKRVTVSARLRNPDGKEDAIEVEGPRDQLGKVIEDLTGKILATLKLEKRAEWDPAREAAQHLEEAKWALRWGMWREAQAAADSAWALGAQSLDAAATRMLAYARDTDSLINYWMSIREQRLRWPIIPPTPGSAEPAFQAIALLQDTLGANPKAFTNETWWAGARESLDQAGKVLEYFYWRPEAREPVSQKLADLRALCHGVMETLIKEPLLRKDYWFAPGENRSPDRMEDYFRDGKDIFSIYARRAGFFCEKPEDTADVYRLLLSGDGFPYLRHEIYAEPAFASRLGGWKWADRKREHVIWDKLASEYLSSTNILQQFEGHIMAITLMPDAPNDTVGIDAIAQKNRDEILGLIRTNRETIMGASSKRKYGELFDAANRHLRQTFEGSNFWQLDSDFFEAYDKRRRQAADREKIAQAKEYLRDKKPYDFQIFAPLMHVNYTTNDAAEVLALLKQYKVDVIDQSKDPRTRAAAGLASLFEMRLNEKLNGPAPAPQNPPTNTQVATLISNRFPRPPMMPFQAGTNRMPGMPGMMMGRGPFGRVNETNVVAILSPSVLRIDQFWHVPVKSTNQEEFESPFGEGGLSAPLLREGNVWMLYNYNSQFIDARLESKSILIGVDPKTWRAEQMIPLDDEAFKNSAQPYRSGFPEPRRLFEVLNGAVYVVGGETLLRRNKASRNWSKFAMPVSAGELWRAGTNLFLLARDSLLQIDPDNGTTKTIASVRRRNASANAKRADLESKLDEKGRAAMQNDIAWMGGLPGERQ